MGQRYVLLGRKEDRNVEVNERERNSQRMFDRYGWLRTTNIGLEIDFDHNTYAQIFKQKDDFSRLSDSEIIEA